MADNSDNDNDNDNNKFVDQSSTPRAGALQAGNSHTTTKGKNKKKTLSDRSSSSRDHPNHPSAPATRATLPHATLIWHHKPRLARKTHRGLVLQRLPQDLSLRCQLRDDRSEKNQAAMAAVAAAAQQRTSRHEDTAATKHHGEKLQGTGDVHLPEGNNREIANEV